MPKLAPPTPISEITPSPPSPLRPVLYGKNDKNYKTVVLVAIFLNMYVFWLSLAWCQGSARGQGCDRGQIIERQDTSTSGNPHFLTYNLGVPLNFGNLLWCFSLNVGKPGVLAAAAQRRLRHAPPRIARKNARQAVAAKAHVFSKFRGKLQRKLSNFREFS